MRAASLVLTLTCLSTWAEAQVLRTLPDGTTRTEGQTAQGTNWRGPRRHQVIYGSSVLTTLGPTGMVSELWLRPDGLVASPARTYDVSVTLSSLGVPSPEAASRSSFRANHGPDVARVASNVRVAFPAIAAGTSGPSAFQVRIPLQPFLLQTPQNLLVELDLVPVDGADPNPWFLDAVTWPNTGWGISIDETGVGCPDPGEFRVYHHTLLSPEQLVLNYASAAPLNAPALFLIGDSNTHLGSLPLPFDLSGLGAPGCLVRNDQDAVAVARSHVHALGSQLVAQVSIPREYAFVGTTVFAQALVLDAHANGLGVRLSPSKRFVFHTPPSPMLGLSLTGSPGWDQPQAQAVNRVPVLGMN